MGPLLPPPAHWPSNPSRQEGSAPLDQPHSTRPRERAAVICSHRLECHAWTFQRSAHNPALTQPNSPSQGCEEEAIICEPLAPTGPLRRGRRPAAGRGRLPGPPRPHPLGGICGEDDDEEDDDEATHESNAMRYQFNKAISIVSLIT